MTLTLPKTFVIDRRRWIAERYGARIDGIECGCAIGQLAMACGVPFEQFAAPDGSGVNREQWNELAGILGVLPKDDRSKRSLHAAILHASDNKNEPEVIRLLAIAGITATYVGEYPK